MAELGGAAINKPRAELGVGGNEKPPIELGGKAMNEMAAGTESPLSTSPHSVSPGGGGYTYYPPNTAELGPIYYHHQPNVVELSSDPYQQRYRG